MLPINLSGLFWKHKEEILLSPPPILPPPGGLMSVPPAPVLREAPKAEDTTTRAKAEETQKGPDFKSDKERRESAAAAEAVQQLNHYARGLMVVQK